MGCKNSSDCNIDSYGEWKYDFGCDCDKTKKKVYLIKLNDVPMMSKAAKIGADVGRFFSLGLTEIVAKGQRLTHDVIEARIRCQCKGCSKYGCRANNGNICNSNPYYTLEYRSNGSSFNNGYYGKTLYEDKVYKPSNMSLNDLELIYNDCEEVDGRNYNLIKFNCKHWAKKVYNKIENVF